MLLDPGVDIFRMDDDDEKLSEAAIEDDEWRMSKYVIRTTKMPNTKEKLPRKHKRSEEVEASRA